MRYDFGIVDRTEPETPMPTRPLDRLLFVQGGLCFFCKQPLPRDDASVEHLQAIANGGANGDDNCVACCKTVNALLGSMSIKQKFEVVLNQKGHFRCPNISVASTPKPVTVPAPSPAPAISKPVAVATPPAEPAPPKPTAPPTSKKTDRIAMVVANLKTRGNSRPRTLKTLTSTVAALFPKGISQAEVAAIVRHLQATGKVKVDGDKVVYQL